MTILFSTILLLLTDRLITPSGGHERGFGLNDGEEQERPAHRRRANHTAVQKAQREAPPDAHVAVGQASASATKETSTQNFASTT